MLRLVLALSLAFSAVEPPKRKLPLVVIHELTRSDDLICAEYSTRELSRQPNRSCVAAATIREWILANGRPTESCGP